MTTFAGQMDFDGPQPFNVDYEGRDRDRDLYPRRGRGVLVRGGIKPVPQVIERDQNLYPPTRGGVKQGIIR